jgi:hypothetical protein
MHNPGMPSRGSPAFVVPLQTHAAPDQQGCPRGQDK